MQIVPGTSIGPFRINSLLGKGGMGEVFSATDTRLDRGVALKLLPSDFASDPDRLRRFQAEAKTLAALNHPNVLVIYEVGNSQGHSYLVSELLEGETLRQKLQTGPIPQRKGLEYALQIVQGLAAAHSNGVIHRDLKPENIFITHDGRVKILDFGLAKLQGSAAPAGALSNESEAAPDAATLVHQTEAGQVVGTPSYMAPEQVRGGRADHRSDIFAFGCVLYELFSGRHPFRRGTSAETMAAILNEHAPELQGLPPSLERIIERCLEKQPDNRFQSAKDLAFAFAEISSLRSPALTERTSAMTPGARQRLPWLLGGAALLLVIGIAAVVAWRSSARGITSVAIKPLDDFSGDTNQAYLSDGMTEALCASLGNISALRVPGRASVMRYKGPQRSIQEMARELKVDAIVEGSVQRAGNRVFITIQLIETATDRHLWATNYQRDLSDFFKVQTEVAQAIAQEVQVRLTPQDRSRLVPARAIKAEAVEAYLKGRFYLSRQTKEGFEQSLASFREAIRLDPEFAKAYAGVADAYNLAAGWYIDDQVAIANALTATATALRLDPGSAETYAALGSAYTYSWHWAEAETALKKCLQLNPRYAMGHLGYGWLLMCIGHRDEEVLGYFRRLSELEPADPAMTTHLGWALVHMGRDAEAKAALEKTLALDPNHFYTQHELGMLRALQGNYPEAIAETERSVQNSPGNVEMLAGLGWVYAVGGETAKAKAILERLSAITDPRPSTMHMALVHVGLGQMDQAIAELRRGLTTHDGGLMFLRFDRRFARLRSDPRCLEIMRAIGVQP